MGIFASVLHLIKDLRETQIVGHGYSILERNCQMSCSEPEESVLSHSFGNRKYFRPSVTKLRRLYVRYLMSRMRTVVQTFSLVLLALLTLPFAVYAINFAQGGLLDSLPAPHYIRSDNPIANLSIFSHMAAGAAITALVPLQLIPSIRRRLPALHRWSGRLIIIAAVATAVGGLVYIPLRGTIGGTAMNIGFSLYGVLVLLTAIQTIRYARARRIADHNAWALRFFWLALGSWFYRVHYGLWYLATDGLWSNPQFTGGFDLAQNVAFFVPYLVGAEVYLRIKQKVERKAFVHTSA